MSEHIDHHCGVGAVVDPQGLADVSRPMRELLGHLDNRGTGACGIVALAKENVGFHVEHWRGKASQVCDFHAATTSALGHDHYKTNPHARPHPYTMRYGATKIAVAFNGNIPETEREQKARAFLASKNFACETGSDTEMIARLLAWHMDDTKSDMRRVFSRMPEYLDDGSYNIALMTEHGHIHGFRDQRGRHPFVIGRTTKDNLHILSSEDSAITKIWDTPGAVKIRDIRPGMRVHLGPGLLRPETEQILKPNPKRCAFEWAYFMSRLSTFDDAEVRKVRTIFGETLADRDSERMKQWHRPIVVPVPESAKIAADGYIDHARLRRSDVLIKKMGAARTFIEPANRAEAVRAKFEEIDWSDLHNRDVILIDDSLVRGTTMKTLLELLQHPPTLPWYRDLPLLRKKLYNTRLHVRFAFPPVVAPCFYGIDFPTRDELLVPKFSPDTLRDDGTLTEEQAAAIAREIGADSVDFLPISAVHKAIGFDEDELCRSCFTGEYATEGAQRLYQLQLGNNA